jgi:hypothetical protein
LMTVEVTRNSDCWISPSVHPAFAEAELIP